ncbi:cilia- and flagella-associated protein 144 [Lampetra fluviatilis]
MSAAKGAPPKEKEPPNEVHQNAILCESIRKEERNLRLYTEFSINPYRKLYAIADKPNAPCNSQSYEDAAFTAAFRRAAQGPREKFTFPQTEAQEVGWNNAPLIDTDRTDRRLNFPRQGSEITTYMEAAWRLKEQTQNLK